MVRFGEQLDRFRTAFDDEQVLVILHDELRADQDATRRRILEFVGADPDRGRLPTAVNQRKEVRSRHLQQVLHRAQQSNAVKRGLRIALPPAVRWRLAHRIKMVNSRPATAERLDAGVERRLLDDLGPDLDRLETLLDRDLSSWREPAPRD